MMLCRAHAGGLSAEVAAQRLLPAFVDMPPEMAAGLLNLSADSLRTFLSALPPTAQAGIAKVVAADGGKPWLGAFLSATAELYQQAVAAAEAEQEAAAAK